jgi:hypothetical protein
MDGSEVRRPAAPFSVCTFHFHEVNHDFLVIILPAVQSLYKLNCTSPIAYYTPIEI